MRLPNPFHPSPAPSGFGEGKTVPEHDTNIFSRSIFGWLTPFLQVGFSRPLEKDDFWQLPQSQLTAKITDDIERNFYARCPPEKQPRHLRETSPEFEDPAESPIKSPLSGHGTDEEKGEEVPEELTNGKQHFPEVKQTLGSKKTGTKPKKYDESLFKALHRTFFYNIWVAGVLKLIADTLRTTTPLLNKVLLQWLTDSYVYHRMSDSEKAAAVQGGLIQKPKGIGYGIGLAVALFAMQEISSLMTNHFMQLTMISGLSVRTGLIGSIFRKSLRISGRGRLNHSVGQITTMISTDTTRLDRFTAFAHVLWIAPLQLAIGIGLLIGNMGYSALVGLGVLLLGFPIQIALVKVMFSQRQKGVKFTDKRVRLTNEVLQGIRLLKFFSWEGFYMHQIGDLRKGEILTLKYMAVARSTMIAMMTFIPILASVLSFITYSLSGHELNVAIIFSSLQLFNVVRAPLIFFPFVLASLSDALVALRRIGSFLTAEDLPKPYDINDDLGGIAINAEGDFTWETVNTPNENGSKFGNGSGGGRAGHDARPNGAKATNDSKNASAPVRRRRWGKAKGAGADDQEKKDGGEGLPQHVEKDAEKEQDSVKEDEKPFELKNLNMTIPKGAFIGIVGRVGSGKSSVLQALVGEMRKIRGDVVFGGTVAYAPQTPWIRNATVRENVLFGQEDDDARFRDVVRACSLEHDIEMLPHGEETEIGEKGINLSGGQKARISLARAAYSKSDIVLLDDPLSAVDAYVGKAILENCLLTGPLANRTRVLVTHSLHVLDKLDYIYVINSGEIIEQGTYEDLMANSVVFSRLIDEYGNAESDDEDAAAGNEARRRRRKNSKAGVGDVSEESSIAKGGKKSDDVLMQAEERITGAVTWDIYSSYMKYAGGLYWGPWILMLLILAQAAGVGNALFLGFWTSESIPGFKQGQYMAVYGGLGVAQAVLTFILSFSFTFACLTASLNLFAGALNGVLRSAIAFFDTTPMGRILSRLSKDQDTLDTDMSMIMFQFSNTFFSVLGTITLVFYTFPYLGILFVPLSILYQLVSVYYRRTSVETKRWDSLLRSVLYGSYSESLTGLSTIRAYREEGRSIKDADEGLDLQNRAYYMTISIQRWLAIRLDLFGNILIFGIGLFAAGFRTSVSPAKIGVVLSYTLSIMQFFSDMVSQFAQIEQNMNAVERVLHYSGLPPEGELHTANEPPASWPSDGAISFKEVEMAYREGLPLVLRGISFEVKPGEKVGIVGRTGAGKSSLLQVLFRTVEIQSGKVEIDGVNTRTIGLETLRSRLALVPQDTVLFLGTLRENLDPQHLRTDAELISVLQRAWLLPKDGEADPIAEAKFSLDSLVGDEGSNFSAGEKQLLALCRALVKNSRVIVLDEATSSVDVETDAKLQRTIQTEFTSSTLLCIAHRLNTIAYYDRVLVMDEGKVAEFDTVLNLYDREDSIFRSLCDEANLQRVDIVRIRSDHDTIVS